MKSVWVPVAIALAVFGATAGSVPAQNPPPTGNIFGTVVDQQGRYLGGVAVALAGPGAGSSTTTDAKGDFHFLNLSPGSYSLKMEREGFVTTRSETMVVPGRNAVIAITLTVAGATESVSVTGQAAGPDSRTTRMGSTFSQEELQTIPTTRDPWAFLRQVPGVLVANMNVSGDAAGTQSAFVGKGSHADQNVFNLDGVTISFGGVTPLFFDFDSFNAIDVTTGGSDPALSTPGVTLNLITRRGTNQLLGSARGLYTGGAGWDYGAEAGGPLWRDRLWLWGAFAHNDVLGQTFYTADTHEPVQETPILAHWNTKLNAQPVASNELTLSFVDFDRSVDGRGAGPSRSQPSTWNNTLDSQTYRAEDSQVFSPHMFGSAYASGLNYAFRNIPQGGLDEQADFIDGVWRNSFVARYENGTQAQAGATVSAFFDTGDLRHELKFGFGYRHTFTDSLSAWPGDQLYGDDSNDPPQAAITRSSYRRYEVNFYDTYLEDTIRADRLTLNVGARFDYQQGRNLPSAVPANPAFPELLPAVAYAGDPSYRMTWRSVQPRIGATLALGSDRKTLLRASYSEFSNQMGSDVTTINAFPGVAALSYVWNDKNGDHRVEPGEVDFSAPLQGSGNVDPNNPSSSAPVNRISLGLVQPTTSELIIGMERPLAPGLLASVAYTHRSVRNSVFSPTIGVSSDNYILSGFATGVASANGFVLPFSEPYYSLTQENPSPGTEVRNRQDFTETYDGVEFQVIKQLHDGWMLRASFAYNNWRQHVGPGAIVDPNNQMGGSNRSGPVVETTATGPTATTIFVNAPWQFNVSGTALLPFGIEAGANLFGRAGFPILYNVAVDDLGTNHEGVSLQIGSVTAYRLASVFELDLHLERAFRLGSTITLIALLDCFNAANSHTVLARDGNVGDFDKVSKTLNQNSTFNDPIEQLTARAFRGGFRITF